MDKIKLTNWTVTGFYNYHPLLFKSMELGKELKGCTPTIPATVPGSVYDALLAAKLIPEPNYELNSQACEWVSARWWLYETKFKLPLDYNQNSYEIIISGIDYASDIYINGHHVAFYENPFVPCKVNIAKEYLLAKNQISVVLRHAPDEFGQIGLTSKVTSLKPRYSFKWDFCPRLVTMGIFGEAWVCEQNPIDWHNAYVVSDESDESFKIKYSINGCDKLVFTLDYKGREKIAVEALPGDDFARLKPDKIRYWNINGRGDANLYNLTMSAFLNDRLLSTKKIKVGFKTIKLLKNDNSSADVLNYLFEINGKKEYIKGVNITPLDILFSRITNERYEKLIADVKNMNANLIRVWGGGFIESEYFYNLCDEHGIMVWQDFTQSGSGIDSAPSEDESFISKFIFTTDYICKQKRNHPCLVAFCGGNELSTGDEQTPITSKSRLIALIENSVKSLCPHIAFFPSTPSGKSFFNCSINQANNHDIHGPWNYLGVEDHYSYFNALKTHFYSEFGCNGMSEINSLKKFLSNANLNVFSMNENFVWRHHGEWWDTFERDTAIFGKFESLEDMISASQFIQAESLRYSIESNRRNAFHNSGCIIWQMNETYPNVSCTSILDYYGEKKLAYYTIKKIFSQLFSSVQYNKLTYNVGEVIELSPYCINDDSPQEIQIDMEIFADDKLLFIKNVLYSQCGFSKVKYSDTIKFNAPNADSVRLKFYHNNFLINDILLLIKRGNYYSIEPVKKWVREVSAKDN